MVLQDDEKLLLKVLNKDVKDLQTNLHIALVKLSFIFASFNMKPYSHQNKKVFVETESYSFCLLWKYIEKKLIVARRCPDANYAQILLRFSEGSDFTRISLQTAASSDTNL